MIPSPKTCLMSWWIVVIIALMLWYRNIDYDRVLAVIVFILGLIQLVEYGCHSMIDPSTAGRLVMMLLLTLIFVLTLSTYLYTNNSMCLIMILILIPFGLVVLVDVIWGENAYSASVDSVGLFSSWTWKGKPILGNWAYLFFTFSFICWLVLLKEESWEDIGLYLIGIYLIITLLYVSLSDDDSRFGSKWCYLLTGLALIAWFIGLFKE